MVQDNLVIGASDTAFDLIKKWEGFRESWYEDAAGVETIGYGTTREALEDMGMSITPPITVQEGNALLRAHAGQKVVQALGSLVSKRLLQAEIDALTSFVYNVGVGAFADSTLLRKLNSDADDPFDELFRWVYVNGTRLEGLVRRRTDEWLVSQGTDPDQQPEEVEVLSPVMLEEGDKIDLPDQLIQGGSLS